MMGIQTIMMVAIANVKLNKDGNAHLIKKIPQ